MLTEDNHVHPLHSWLKMTMFILFILDLRRPCQSSSFLTNDDHAHPLHSWLKTTLFTEYFTVHWRQPCLFSSLLTEDNHFDRRLTSILFTGDSFVDWILSCWSTMSIFFTLERRLQCPSSFNVDWRVLSSSSSFFQVDWRRPCSSSLFLTEDDHSHPLHSWLQTTMPILFYSWLKTNMPIFFLDQNRPCPSSFST